MIEKLTEIQEKQISLYQQKWGEVVLSSTPVERSLAVEAVQFSCLILNLPAPEILFLPSSYAGVETVIFNHFNNPLAKTFYLYYRQTLFNQVASQLSCTLHQELYRWVPISLESRLSALNTSQIRSCFIP